ncbi:MAG: DegT/DnrJ/EryC1/StrS family aminotransferase, partial [Planctomycetota bacterium]
MSDSIPLVDLQAQYAAIQAEIDAAVAGVLERCDFVNGAAVAEFEGAFAAHHGAAHAVACANGTDALELALQALGVGPGDEVITAANTFAATVEAILTTGATPVLLDVDPATLLLDPALLPAACSGATKAIIPVHLYGQPCDLDPILAVARERGLRVIEDAAQAHGARYGGRRIGALGDIGTFSFFPGKNLGAYGDGGALVTNDPALAGAVAQRRNHGRTEKYVHDVPGRNSRLDTLQAAVLRVKLRHLDAWTARRRALAAAYDAALADRPGVTLPVERANAESVYHLYVIRLRDRAARDAAAAA